MCGIVGYIGKNNTKKILLDGLAELEYRGYDSAGIAILSENDFSFFKAVGKLKNLVEKTENYKSEINSIGIGHTRWATHGKPTELNAHPHIGENSYLVHNGIIENYQKLKKVLIDEGFEFISQTDTEVIIHLFEFELRKTSNTFKAFENTLKQLEGAYSILLITESQKNSIYFAKYGSPLIIGTNETNEKFFASSDAPLIGLAKEVLYLNDGNYGVVTQNNIAIYDKSGDTISLQPRAISQNRISAQKEGYRFFMEKEIYEQSTVIADTLMGRLNDNSVDLEECVNLDFSTFNEIKLCACGTSYHSALTASYLIERIAKVRCSVEIGSEFRYKDPLLTDDTLFVVISQSGETADTLESLKMARRAGLKSLAICNVDNSSMVRIADSSILTRAGIEKGVASTKAFTTQVAVLWMLSLQAAIQKKTIEQEELENQIHVLRELPKALTVSADMHERIRRLSKRYLHGHGFFFIGRDIFFPLALEGALKLKEISYLHAEGYPSGEMKHGPIALADPELFTIALMPVHSLYEKVKSNAMELSARDSTICAISPKYFENADDFIQTKPHHDKMLEFFEMAVVLQLLAMEISIRLGNDVDMPRNLAKSVTVE